MLFILLNFIKNDIFLRIFFGVAPKLYRQNEKTPIWGFFNILKTLVLLRFSILSPFRVDYCSFSNNNLLTTPGLALPLVSFIICPTKKPMARSLPAL